MSLVCSEPDSTAGVAVRLSDFLDCQARALGENGFQALAGGPIGMSVLSGLLTIFIGLIGYRLILGEVPGIRHGVNWTIRLGFVLALVTSWPAFQTLVYRVMADGPGEMAAIVLPAAGLPSQGLDGRVQQAYDAMRFGPGSGPLPSRPAEGANGQGEAAAPALAQPSQFQPPVPKTASLFVLATTGSAAAFRIAIGFLLAIGPLAIMALLFDATLGLFVGWVRALAGMAFASLGAAIVTATGLILVEGELAHLQALRAAGTPHLADPQGLTTIVTVLALLAFVTGLAAMRMTGALRLSWRSSSAQSALGQAQASAALTIVPALATTHQAAMAGRQAAGQGRAAGVAESLAASVRREQFHLVESGAANKAAPHAARPATGGPAGIYGNGIGTSARRSLGRRTRSAARRDRGGK
ncbi:MAG: type IV secretion system protein [Sphingosinicella sp.]|nr:type IV secretion system protein [Sphingosinicella sp.]